MAEKGSQTYQIYECEGPFCRQRSIGSGDRDATTAIMNALLRKSRNVGKESGRDQHNAQNDQNPLYRKLVNKSC